MKIFKVTTQSANNSMNVHHLSQGEFATTNYDEAVSVFNKEVEELEIG